MKRIYIINLISIRLFILLIFISILSSSCMDCFHSGYGVVIDGNSNNPIDSVLIEAFLLNKNESVFIKQIYTDSSGRFEIGTGNLSKKGCDKDFIIILSKSGYENSIVFKPKDDTIFLEKVDYKREYLEKIFKR